MNQSRPPIADSSLALLAKGYTWLPDRWRRTGAPLVRTRLMGQHAVALQGPEAVRFFYDERHVERGTALPGPVLSTLFGHGAVHTLDGPAHRVRKEMFLSLLTGPKAVAEVVDRVTEVWDEAVQSWPERPVVLFDEASRILTRGVCQWAGIPVDDADSVARDMVAMVDGFATPGPRHWRARRARSRSESWLAGLVEDVRAGDATAPAGSVLEAVVSHRDADGRPLDPHTAAVELLNVIRPTVAVCWFVSYAGHALRTPGVKERLREDDPAYAVAFAHELRRFYPFAPFLGGRAVTDLEWRGEPIPSGTLILLDLYGQNHDPDLWDAPYAFAPQRFVGRPPRPDELVPQGGADRATGHRCPGEDITVALLAALGPRLARLEYDVPEQDLRIPLNRMPARVRSGFVLHAVRARVTASAH
ncbi:fatty-acid peroxygenase [Streptomyces sp. SAI-135]|uniref:cytochrome P450 n=1 Tax=unclassified Streptomyces TaxID=2593676 RepID=UPI002475118E|nr:MULTISPECIES: cytochrome P450 [unclassified Streptomyces]MDH6514964.1 fatty-acid peroxygenase [Streptomyces sp. SAI-090]MDH6547179.1 fatty-acid peroxygenase [Streptomyces sp. SAI-041]MDH6620952.1 fatty-acid peroxygenase [Streptomyces sp. SAI-135]